MKIETRALLTIGLLIGLFIFVVCVSVFGQDTENVYTPPMAGGEIEITLCPGQQGEWHVYVPPFTGDKVVIDWSEEYFTKEILTLYDQYKESLSGLYVSDGPKEGFTESLYTPKEPTFTGFMEFIREKQK